MSRFLRLRAPPLRRTMNACQRCSCCVASVVAKGGSAVRGLSSAVAPPGPPAFSFAPLFQVAKTPQCRQEIVRAKRDIIRKLL